ncbi:MAG: hypothetical protein R2694_07985 [Ilumatobacteraceae bacterium]|nr:hypothetical protein [Ilumatobacteraceae bacterium]
MIEDSCCETHNSEVDAQGRLSNPSDALVASCKILPRLLVGPTPTRHVVVSVRQQHRLGPQDITELVAGRERGATIEALARRFHIHRTTVMEHLRRGGSSTVRCRAEGLDRPDG